MRERTHFLVPKASLHIFAISFFCLLILSNSALAQRSTITGFVFGPERRPVERARVELTDDFNASLKRTESEPSGRFVFTNVGTGRFQVKVIVPGSDYGEQVQSVEIGGGGTRGFETVQVEFHLRPRTAAAKAAAVVVFVQEVPEEAKKLFQAAVSDLEGNRTYTGIEHLQQAISIFPAYFAALERLGVEYMKAKKYEEARETFAAAVAANSRSFNGWYGLSYANFATNRFEDALDAAAKASAIDKNAAEVYFVTALSQRKLKQYEAAEKSFVRAKQLDNGRTPDIHWNLALLYAHNLQQYGKAADELELFLKATPDNPDAASIRKLIANFRSKHAESK